MSIKLCIMTLEFLYSLVCVWVRAPSKVDGENSAEHTWTRSRSRRRWREDEELTPPPGTNQHWKEIEHYHASWATFTDRCQPLIEPLSVCLSLLHAKVSSRPCTRARGDWGRLCMHEPAMHGAAPICIFLHHQEAPLPPIMLLQNRV